MQRTRLSKNLAATTKDMREIARNAHRLGLNRQMKPAQFKLLDPRGTHIISPKFYHDRADGKLVEWHCRCDVHLKLLGKQKAVELVMDISDSFLADYLTLEEHRDLVQHGKDIKAIEWEEGDPAPMTDRMQAELMNLDDIKQGNEATPNADKLDPYGLEELAQEFMKHDKPASAEGKG